MDSVEPTTEKAPTSPSNKEELPPVKSSRVEAPPPGERNEKPPALEEESDEDEDPYRACFKKAKPAEAKKPAGLPTN